MDRTSGPAPVVVVLPARNEAAILPLTLPSLLSQSGVGRVRILLVDDQSTDGTPRILAALNPLQAWAFLSERGWHLFAAVGAIVLGVYADRVGRKAALTLTILMMALGTAIIGLAPTYDSIGLWAPALIVLGIVMWKRGPRKSTGEPRAWSSVGPLAVVGIGAYMELINLFTLPSGATVVDLPGYGYAAVPGRIKQGWQEMIEGYLLDREELRQTFVLVDGEIGPTKLDVQMLDWARAVGIPHTIVATKMDKVKSSKRDTRKRDLAEGCRLEKGDIVWVSSSTGVGIDQLRSAADAAPLAACQLPYNMRMPLSVTP